MCAFLQKLKGGRLEIDDLLKWRLRTVLLPVRMLWAGIVLGGVCPHEILKTTSQKLM